MDKRIRSKKALFPQVSKLRTRLRITHCPTEDYKDWKQDNPMETPTMEHKMTECPCGSDAGGGRDDSVDGAGDAPEDEKGRRKVMRKETKKKKKNLK